MVHGAIARGTGSPHCQVCHKPAFTPPAWPLMALCLQPLPWALQCLRGKKNQALPIRFLGWTWLLPRVIFIPELAWPRRGGQNSSQMQLTEETLLTARSHGPGAAQPHHGFLIASSAGLEPGACAFQPRAQEHRTLVLLAPTLPRSGWTLASACLNGASDSVLPWALCPISPPLGNTSHAEALPKKISEI